MVQSRTARATAGDRAPVDAGVRAARRVPVLDRGPLPPAGARPRRVGGAPAGAVGAVRPRRRRQLRGARHRRRRVPDHHAVDRRRGEGDLRPLSRHPRDEPRPGRPRQGLRRAPPAVRRPPEHLRRALQRRAAARLVPCAGPRLRHDARRGARRQRHPDVGRREPHRRRPRRRRAAAPLRAAAQARARPRELPPLRRHHSARRVRPALPVSRRHRLDHRVDGRARRRLSGAGPAGLRRALDRRLREPGQAQRRLLGVRVRRASVHAAQLERHARQRLHAGPRDGPLDAHDAGARDAAVRVFELHDLRRRGAVDAERGAAARLHAGPGDRSARAGRAAAARHRRGHQHLLSPGAVRQLRARGAPEGRARRADHGREPEHAVSRPADRLLRRHAGRRPAAARDVGPHPALLRLALLRLSVRHVLRLERPAAAGRPGGRIRRSARTACAASSICCAPGARTIRWRC